MIPIFRAPWDHQIYAVGPEIGPMELGYFWKVPAKFWIRAFNAFQIFISYAYSYLYLFIVNHSYLYLFIVIQCDLEDVGINPWCSSPKTARTATERSPATALLRRSVRISSRRWGSGWIGNDRNLKRLKSWTNIGDSIESIIHRIGWRENLQENPKKLMVKTVVSG